MARTPRARQERRERAARHPDPGARPLPCRRRTAAIRAAPGEGRDGTRRADRSDSPQDDPPQTEPTGPRPPFGEAWTTRRRLSRVRWPSEPGRSARVSHCVSAASSGGRGRSKPTSTHASSRAASGCPLPAASWPLARRFLAAAWAAGSAAVRSTGRCREAEEQMARTISTNEPQPLSSVTATRAGRSSRRARAGGTSTLEARGRRSRGSATAHTGRTT